MKQVTYQVKMLSLLFCFLYPLVLGATPEESEIKTAKPSVIEKVKSEASRSISVLTIYTSGTDLSDSFVPKVKKLSGAIQINLGLVEYNKKDKFLNLDSPHLNKVAFFRNSSNQTEARIFTHHPPEAVKESLDISIFENRIVVTLDHQLLKTFNQKYASAKKLIASAKKKTVSASAEIVGPLTPSKLSTASKTPEQPIRLVGKSSPELSIHNSTKKLGLISAVMAVLFLFFLLLKPLIKKHKRRLAMDSKEPLINLGTLNLAPKQQVSLVQVGGEKLLLAVGPTGINLLKDMEKPKVPSQNLVPQPAVGGQRSAQKINPPTQQRLSPYKPEKKIYTETQQKRKPQNLNKPEQNLEKKRPNKKLATQEPVKNAKPKAEKPQSNEQNSNRLEPNLQKPQAKAAPVKEPETIEDITKLLREKLKNLPNMG